MSFLKRSKREERYL